MACKDGGVDRHSPSPPHAEGVQGERKHAAGAHCLDDEPQAVARYADEQVYANGEHAEIRHPGKRPHWLLKPRGEALHDTAGRAKAQERMTDEAALVYNGHARRDAPAYEARHVQGLRHGDEEEGCLERKGGSGVQQHVEGHYGSLLSRRMIALRESSSLVTSALSTHGAACRRERASSSGLKA